MVSTDSLLPNPDLELLEKIANSIYDAAGSKEKFESKFPHLVRQAYDEVIDTPRSGRLILDELEKTEKTYIGTKVEILLRGLLRFPKGKLDMVIDGVDVDVKNTVRDNWMIPSEAINHVCILIKSNEKKSVCSFGIFLAKTENLNAGTNKDGKRSVSKFGKENTLWLLKDVKYPESFWEKIDPAIAEEVFVQRHGTKRLEVLFRRLLETPISRTVIAGIAQQHDYMKRIRKNGGARDKLAKEEIAILGGKADYKLIEQLGLPPISNDEFYSYKCKSHADRILLLSSGKIE